MKATKVKIINNSAYPIPQYATAGASGVDLYANIKEPLTIHFGEIIAVPTGIKIKLEPGTEAQLRARSGLSFRHGLTITNGIGTIDSDYTGEIKVLLALLKNEPYTIAPGQRIAQLVFSSYLKAEFDVCESLEDTPRGEGGLGSTGL